MIKNVKHFALDEKSGNKINQALVPICFVLTLLINPGAASAESCGPTASDGFSAKLVGDLIDFPIDTDIFPWTIGSTGSFNSGNFNVATGVFTASAAGFYIVAAQINANTEYYIAINGVSAGKEPTTELPLPIVIHLNKNDTLSLRLTGAMGTINSGDTSWFSVFRLK